MKKKDNYKHFIIYTCFILFMVLAFMLCSVSACPPYGNFVAGKSICLKIGHEGIVRGSIGSDSDYSILIDVNNPNDATNPATMTVEEYASEVMPYESYPTRTEPWSKDIPYLGTETFDKSYKHKWIWLYHLQEKWNFEKNLTNGVTQVVLNRIGMLNDVYGKYMTLTQIGKNSPYDQAKVFMNPFDQIDNFLMAISILEGKIQTTYHYMPKSSNIDGLEPVSVIISISPSKVMDLGFAEFNAVLASIYISALGFPEVTGPAAGVLLFKALVHYGLAAGALQAAVDPDPNYWDPIVLKNSSTLGFGNISLNDIPNSSLKDVTASSLDGLIYQEAYKETYIKYLGAVEVNDTIWQKKLLKECYYYASLIEDKNNEIDTELPSAIQDLDSMGFHPTIEEVEEMKTNFSNNGLPPYVIQSMRDAGYYDEEISSARDFILNVPDAYIVNFTETVADSVEKTKDYNHKLIDDCVTKLGDDAPPYANFSISVTQGNAPLFVQFNDTSIRFPKYWYWDFGDGTHSTEQNPSHIYNLTGNYSVNLTVTNTTTGSDSKYSYHLINVFEKIPLMANFTAVPVTGIVPLNVSFTDTSEGSPSQWYWDFGDNYSSTEQNPIHMYNSIGNFSVNLTINNSTDNKSLWKKDFIQVIEKIPLIANFTAEPITGIVPLNVSFTDTSEGSPSQWYWDFGDNYSSTEQNPIHMYNSMGYYSVNCTIRNNTDNDSLCVNDLIQVIDNNSSTIDLTMPTVVPP